MSYNFTEIRKNIYLVESDTLYELSSMFIRLQEFYESPFDNIREKYFTLEEYMDTYAKENGNFTYFSDWSGFNLPCWAFQIFFDVFQYDLREKEFILRQGIENLHRDKNLAEKFYVIGSVKGNQRVIDHELAHAYYYLNINYEKQIDDQFKIMEYNLFDKAEDSLIEKGYHHNMIRDEIQAYLATIKDRKKLLEVLGWDRLKQVRVPSSFKKIFKEFDSSYK